jgi:hypothetical protein
MRPLPDRPTWSSGTSRRLEGLVHHSDRGSQYLSIRYTEPLTQAGAVTSVGSRGDSFDNALAETIIGLYKTELIRQRGPWKGLDEVEYATLEWVDWFNHHRLLEPIGHLPPAEFEAAYHRREDPSRTTGLKDPSGWRLVFIPQGALCFFAHATQLSNGPRKGTWNGGWQHRGPR